MATAFVGEIRSVAFNFAPQGWFVCDGSLLSISNYDVLFNLLGTTYGGDGINTFALPDLRSRVPIGSGSGSGLSPRTQGQQTGIESVALTSSTTAPHSHAFAAVASATNAVGNPAGALPASTGVTFYSDQTPNTSMNSGAVASAGSSLPHTNIQPYQAQMFIIAWAGGFPSQN